MALLKEIETASGATAGYWRITRIDFDVHARKAWYVLAGYRDKAARDAGRQPLREQPFTMPMAIGATPETVGRPELYADALTQIGEARETPEFADAESDE